MHDICIVLAGKNVTSAAHIGGKLVDFIEAAVNQMLHKIGIAEIANHEVVGLCLAIARVLKVSAANPESVSPESTYEMVRDESSGSADQRDLWRRSLPQHAIYPLDRRA
jgi:hypothetical protein